MLQGVERSCEVLNAFNSNWSQWQWRMMHDKNWRSQLWILVHSCGSRAWVQSLWMT